MLMWEVYVSSFFFLTVVDVFRCDLFSAVSAVRHGKSSVLQKSIKQRHVYTLPDRKCLVS